MEFFPQTWSAARSQGLIEHFQRFIANRGWGFWAVEELESSRFVGFVGLNEVPEASGLREHVLYEITRTDFFGHDV